MVQAVVHARVFKRHDIPYIAHHTQQASVSFGRSADGTGLGIGYIVAMLAIADIVSEINQCVAEFLHHFAVLRKQKKSKPQGGLASDTGQPVQFVNGVFQ